MPKPRTAEKVLQEGTITAPATPSKRRTPSQTTSSARCCSLPLSKSNSRTMGRVPSHAAELSGQLSFAHPAGNGPTTDISSQYCGFASTSNNLDPRTTCAPLLLDSKRPLRQPHEHAQPMWASFYVSC
eukprot:3492745-Amphidinium_carterae.1